ncbi:MAG: HEAT repeat domain-containing protein [Candidatus Sericytochromatia bacterium]|nr:HEAT repeat domain-containing protein [Candidatus Sericytochromatia bacterium]
MDDVNALIDALIGQAPELTNTSHSSEATADGQQGQIFRHQALLALTEHPDLSLRQQAAEMLAEHQTALSLAALQRLSADPAPEVRLPAVSSLSHFSDDASVLPVLLERLQDSDYLVRSTAAEALGNRPQLPPQALEALIGVLTDKNAVVRATAAEALGAQNAFLASPALEDRLLDSDQWVRFSAAESLHQIAPEEEIWPLLMDANSKDTTARLNAIQALGKLLDRRAIPALVRMLKDAPELTPEVLKTLQQFHDPLVIPALVETALFTELAHLREQALLDAQQLSLNKTLQALSDWLDSDNRHYAQRAIEVLHHLPTEDCHPILLKALEHSDSWVRTVALLSLSGRKVAAPADRLKNLLSAAQPQDLQTAALEQLMRYHPDQSIQEMATFAQAEADWQRLSVASHLHYLPEHILDQSCESFQTLLHDSSSDVREAAMMSIGKMPYANCLPFLIQGTADEDSWVRQAAVAGLEQHLDPQATENLLTCLAEDSDFLVRARAAEALGKHISQASWQGLNQALTDDKPSVRVQAARSLFQLHQQGLPAELSQFQTLLQDSDRNVLITVLEQLRRTPQQGLQQALQGHLSARDPQIAAAAQQAYSAIS